MDPLHKQVAAFAARYGLLPHGARVVVAVSGGPDSLCLLHVLQALAPERKLALKVAHFDHLLRPDSGRDAEYVARLAEAWGLPVAVGRGDVAAHARARRLGVEAAARELRYAFLVREALAWDAGTIALGHTADDQAETVLLRLMRGAGPSGLAAMRPRRRAGREHAELWLVRPLLEARREQVEGYCRAHGIRSLLDPSNQEPIYTRNSVRGYILPLLKTYNSSIVATLARTARICAEEDELVDGFVDLAWRDIAAREGTQIVLDRAGFAALHRALRRRIVRRAVAEIEPELELGARHVDLALDAIEARRRRLQLPGGVWLSIGHDKLRIGRRELSAAPAGGAGEGGDAA